MIGVQKYLAILLLSVSWAAAQNSTGTVSVQHVTAVTDGADLRVEVTLTSPVDVASVEAAVNPDRILIDLPGTDLQRLHTKRKRQRRWHSPGADWPAQHQANGRPCGRRS